MEKAVEVLLQELGSTLAEVKSEYANRITVGVDYRVVNELSSVGQQLQEVLGVLIHCSRGKD